MSQNESVELRHSQINSYKASGMSAVKWCKENQMKLCTLRYWLRKIKAEQNQKQSENGWVSFAVDNPVHTPGSLISIKAGAFSVEIQPGFDRSTLTEVITAIHGLCQTFHVDRRYIFQLHHAI